MCDLCAPRISRRRLIGGLVAGGAAVSAATLLGPPTALAAVPVAPGLDIEPRSNWAGEGRPPTGPLSGETVQFLLVHHTASANGADPVETMRTAYGFHTSPEKGWPDVAYNFFIDQNGITWEGRAGSIAGPVESPSTEHWPGSPIARASRSVRRPARASCPEDRISGRRGRPSRPTRSPGIAT